MIQELFDKNIFIYVIVGFCGLGILVKGMVAFIYGSLIRASYHMGNSQNKLMKLIRLKFETCYKIKIGVNNVDTFVDKYVYRHRFCGILLYTWENLSGQFLILCLLSGSVASVLGLAYECGRREILSTFFAGLFTSALLISFDYLINLYIKRRVLKTNIKEYLENFLKARLENEEFKPELLEQYRKEYFDQTKQKKDKVSSRVIQNSISKDYKELKEESAVSQVDKEIKEPEEEEGVELVEIIDLGNNPKKSKGVKKVKRDLSSLEISKKEEKIIEDILKEYLV